MLVVTGDLWIQVCVGHSQRWEGIFSIFIKGIMEPDGFHLDTKMILKAVEFLVCLRVSWIKQSQSFF